MFIFFWIFLKILYASVTGEIYIIMYLLCFLIFHVHTLYAAIFIFYPARGSRWIYFSILMFFHFFLFLFHCCCSHVQVFGKALVHEFPIFYSHTWHCLLFCEKADDNFGQKFAFLVNAYISLYAMDIFLEVY